MCMIYIYTSAHILSTRLATYNMYSDLPSWQVWLIGEHRSKLNQVRKLLILWGIAMDLPAHMGFAMGFPSKQGHRRGSQHAWSSSWGSPANRGIALGLSACMVVVMGFPSIQGRIAVYLSSYSIINHYYRVSKQTGSSPWGFQAVSNIVMVYLNSLSTHNCCHGVSGWCTVASHH